MPISDDEFDQLPEGTPLEQEILVFLGKEPQAYTAEEIRTAGVGQIIVHSNVPRRNNEAPGPIIMEISLDELKDTLEAMVQKPGARANLRRPLEARNKDGLRYYRRKR